MRDRRSARARALFWAGLLAALAAAHWRAFRGWVIADRDAARIFFPDSAFLARCLRGGELPLWQPYALLGSSLVASLQAQVFYPPRVLAVLIAGPYWGLTLMQVAHAGVAAAGAFLLARALGRSAEASALCAVAFGLSPVLVDLASTPNLVHAAAWAPWVVLAARRRRMRAVAGFLALSLLAGSPEMTLWEVGVLALASARRRTWARLAGAAAWAAAMAAAALVPAAEAALASARGTARVDPLDWSASPRQLLAMAWPLADSPRGPYWGPDQWLLINVFAGTAVVALAVVGARSSRRARPFAIGAVVLGLLALGRAFPPAAWVLSAPPLNVLRYPAKYVVGVLFCLAVLAAYGVDALAARRRWRETRGARWAIGLGAGAVLVLMVGGLLLPMGLRAGLLWIVLVLAAGGAAAWWSRRAVVAVAVLELAVFHALRVGYGWAPASEVARPAAFASQIDRRARISVPVGRRADAANATVELSREPSEVLLSSRQTFTPNRFAEDGVRALEGYGAPEPARIFDFQLSGQRAVADLAGVQYFLRAGAAPFPDLRSVSALPGDLRVYLSQTAFPRAWVVPQASVSSDADVLKALEHGSSSFRDQALLADGAPLEGAPCPAASAEVTGETCRSLELTATACAGGGVLVVSDAHAPGWRAEVDGQPAEVHRADLALRAVHLPPGTHRVRMTYSPWTLWLGLAVSALAVLALAALRPARLSSR
ncbi:MAG TPA: YfhO family protein [Myxococcales bacterium]|nr:YfhO family protein [Myxococcales bacterium]